MYDQFDNLVSTGPFTSTNTLTSIAFDAETTSNGGLTDSVQNPTWLPGTTTYNLVTGNAQLCLTNYFSLLAAGSRWLKADDDDDPLNITTERGWNLGGVVYSTRPFITVSAGPPSQFVVAPTADVNVPAGSQDAFGNYPISARLTDAYNNFSSSAGIVVKLSVVNVSGSTGTVSADVVGSSITPPTPVSSVVTDSSGTIGISSPLQYYVSHLSGDVAAVNFFSNIGVPVTNTTGRLITVGGTTRKLVFTQVPLSQVAGKTALNLPPFTLQRRDDFNNVSIQGIVTVALDYSANSQVAVHANSGYSSGNHDFEFETLGGTPISGLTFLGGESTQDFVYFDKMSSTPLEDGRIGTWTLRAFVGSDFTTANVRVSTTILVTPDVTAKLAFHNPARTLQAGLPFNPSGNLSLSTFDVEMQDFFGNPTPALSTMTVSLVSYRLNSSTYNAYGFSVSSGILPPPPPTAPGFLTPTTTVQINQLNWGTTFYYMDTNASENYAVPSSSPLLSALVFGQTWSTGTQNVSILPGVIYKIGLLNTTPTLTAGTTSPAFLFATEDIYANPSPITVGDSGGPTAAFQLTTNSLGALQFASPFSTSTWLTGCGHSADINITQSTMTFYMIDTLAGPHTLTVAKSGSGLASASTNYLILPAPATQLQFDSPSRYLVAGTTTQYEPNYLSNITTNTVITVSARDPYLNLSPVSSNTVVNFFTNSGGAHGWTDSANLASFHDISGPIFSPNVLPVQMLAGSSQVNMYYFDTVKGTQTMTAYDGSGGLTAATTTHYISPAPAAYITIEPYWNATTPLPVNNLLPMGKFVARDQFGNIATGDTKNGQYYTGTLLFATSGSTTTVQMYDSNNLTQTVSSYTYKVADAGVYPNLLITDSVQETLQVSATDFVTVEPPLVPGNNSYDPTETQVRGYTDDAARTVPVHSLGPIVTAGVVMTPTDLSPVPSTDPTYANKQQLLQGTPWQNKQNLAQGDGIVTTSPPAIPVPMLRLAFRVLPTAYSSSTIVSQIVVVKQVTGPDTLGDTDISEIGLYSDPNNDGVFEPETVVGQPPDRYAGQHHDLGQRRGDVRESAFVDRLDAQLQLLRHGAHFQHHGVAAARESGF